MKRTRASQVIRHLGLFAGVFAGFGVLMHLANVENLPVFVAPLAASTCIVYVVPRSRFAQPLNVVGGHVLSALTGSAVYAAFGDGWYAGALCVAMAIVLMEAAQVMHPPAAATSIIALTTGQGFLFAFAPVGLGAVVTVVMAMIVHKALRTGEYPRRRRYIRIVADSHANRRDVEPPQP